VRTLEDVSAAVWVAPMGYALEDLPIDPTAGEAHPAGLDCAASLDGRAAVECTRVGRHTGAHVAAITGGRMAAVWMD
jgi:hypothetical protein